MGAIVRNSSMVKVSDLYEVGPVQLQLEKYLVSTLHGSHGRHAGKAAEVYRRRKVSTSAVFLFSFVRN